MASNNQNYNEFDYVDNSNSDEYISEYIDVSTSDEIVDYRLINKYRYTIAMTAIIDEDKSKNIKAERIEIQPREITDFIIEHDFMANFHPILKTSLVLKTFNCKKIQNNKNNIKFKVTFNKYIYDDDESGDEEKREKVFEGYFQPVFITIALDTTGEILETEVEDSSKEGRRYLELYLFNIDHINENKKIINFIANKCAPKDAVGYILNQVNLNRVIMDIPNITKVYNQILVPPKNFKNSIQTVAEQYGIYKEGYRQYIDFDRYYLLANKLNKKIPVEQNEYPNIYINVVRNKDTGKLRIGSYVDRENKCYVINTANNIQANTYGVLEKEILGNKMRIYERKELENAMKYNEKNKTFSFKTGYKEEELKSDGYNAKLPSGRIVNDKITYAYNSNETDSARGNVATLSSYSNLEFSLTFIDIDISFLTMNKRYIFKFLDTNIARIYNGIYMIEKLVSGYNSESGELYTMGRFVRVE